MPGTESEQRPEHDPQLWRRQAVSTPLATRLNEA
jgi:hypothetical protein